MKIIIVSKYHEGNERNWYLLIQNPRSKVYVINIANILILYIFIAMISQVLLKLTLPVLFIDNIIFYKFQYIEILYFLYYLVNNFLQSNY